MNSKYNLLNSLSGPYRKFLGRRRNSPPSNLSTIRRDLFDSGYPEHSDFNMADSSNINAGNLDFDTEIEMDNFSRQRSMADTGGGSVRFANDKTTASDNNPFSIEIPSSSKRTSKRTSDRIFSAPTLPPFSAQNAKLWFGIAESIFRQHQITSELDKFDLAISSLGPRHLESVEYVIFNRPEHRPYSFLKNALLSEHEVSEHDRLNRLLHHTTLGDQKPSEMLRDMRKFMGTQNRSIPQIESLLRNLFLDKMPSDIRKILVGYLEDDLDNLALRADEIMSQSRRPEFNDHSNFAHNDRQAVVNRLLESQICSLTDKFNKLASDDTANGDRNPRSRYQSANFSRPESRETFNRQFSGPTNRFGRSDFRPRIPEQRRPTFNHSFEDRRPRRFERAIPNRTQGNYSRRENHFDSRPKFCYFHQKFGRDAYKCVPPCAWTGPRPKNA
ncbi:unnamed protein product [Clavelina lepadiformis]|uniref:DUF7041 domain-containing protein n=1 Tax=Clavelina lepadiformis TaxID=159417 RepID=A0ABP0G5A7_CLALP